MYPWIHNYRNSLYLFIIIIFSYILYNNLSFLHPPPYTP